MRIGCDIYITAHITIDLFSLVRGEHDITTSWSVTEVTEALMAPCSGSTGTRADLDWYQV